MMMRTMVAIITHHRHHHHRNDHNHHPHNHRRHRHRRHRRHRHNHHHHHKCDVFTILRIQRASVAVMKLYINRSICSASSVFLCALLRGPFRPSTLWAPVPRPRGTACGSPVWARALRPASRANPLHFLCLGARLPYPPLGHRLASCRVFGQPCPRCDWIPFTKLAFAFYLYGSSEEVVCLPQFFFISLFPFRSGSSRATL